MDPVGARHTTLTAAGWLRTGAVGALARPVVFWALCGALTAAVLALQVSGWLGWLIDRAAVVLVLGAAILTVYGGTWLTEVAPW